VAVGRARRFLLGDFGLRGFLDYSQAGGAAVSATSADSGNIEGASRERGH